ncbi:hypothetical protein B0H15DRAFT_947478 [Mycena belliarum]|uniref:Uncharacterized protein n=1 Tax=Mycena belliarum TaxID=1033014 RepID=A0AAD6U6Y4_9AGAR|nr:hypothetical protein B0H15DRAFT_947478 [Mycena belliae]
MLALLLPQDRPGPYLLPPTLTDRKRVLVPWRPLIRPRARPAVPAARIRSSTVSGAGHAARHTQLPATASFGPAPPLLRAHRPDLPPRAPPPFPPPASGPAQRAGRGTLRDTPSYPLPPRLGPPRLCCALTARISPRARPRRSRRPHPAQHSERGGARCAAYPATRYPLVWARPASAARSPPGFPPARAPAVPAARIRPSTASGAGHAARHTQLPATPSFGPAPPLLRAHRPDFPPPRAPPPFPPPASGPAQRAGRGTLRGTPSYPLPPRLGPPRLCCALTARISPPRARPRRSRRPHPPSTAVASILNIHQYCLPCSCLLRAWSSF